MAYRKNFLEEEAQKNVAQGAAVGQNTLSPRSTTGQSAEVQAGQTAGAGPGANAPQAGASPTGYIPLQQYLQANVGAGAGVKNILGGQVESTKTAAEQEIGKAQSEAEARAKETAAAYQKEGTQTRADLGWAPRENVTKAQQFLEKTYQGPEASPYTAQIGASQAAAQQKLGLLGSEEGKQAAIQSGVKQPYKASYGALDRFLFAQDPAAKAQFEAQQKQAQAGLGEKKTAATQAVESQINLAKEKLKQEQGKLKQTAVDVEAAKTKRAEARVKALNKEEQRRAEEFAKRETEQGKRIADKVWTPGQAASYGDVLSAEGLADLEALAQISGTGFDQAKKQKTYKKGQGSYTVKV